MTVRLEGAGASISTGGFLFLDQTVPQTIINGSPTAQGINFTEQAVEPTVPVNDLNIHSHDSQGITVLHASDSTGFTYELGEDTYFIARNTTASIINKGQLCYVNGATGVTPNVALAKADNLTTINVAGVAAENIPVNGFGRCFISGVIENIDTSAFNVGDVLYASATSAGYYTATYPNNPNYAKKIGDVVVKGVGNGKILIRVAATFGRETGTNNQFTAPSFISSTTSGSPYACSSTSLNTNLNADLFDGKNSTDFLFLDQTTPQSIINGYPITTTGWQFSSVTSATAPSANNIKLYTLTTQGHTRPVYQDDDGSEITIGRDNFIIAKNTTASTINKGTAVYITGSTGNVPNIGLAKADSLTTLPAIGLTMANISANNFGYVQLLGILPQINTSGFSANDRLFVSATSAGMLTSTRPTYPSYAQRVGSILVSGVGNGSIDVTIAPFIGGEESGTTSNFQSSGNITGVQLISNASVGTAPLVVTSTTPVANLSIGGNSATATTATYAQTSSFATNSSIAATANTATYAQVSSFSTNASISATASTAIYAQTSSFATNASIAATANTATFATTAATATTSTYASTCSLATNATTAASANSATWASTSSATNALNSLTTVVLVSAASAPSANQVLMATSSTSATWQTSSASTNFEVVHFTRDMTTASGTQNVSCTKGTPKCITFLWDYGTGNDVGTGFDDGVTHVCAQYYNAASDTAETTLSLAIYNTTATAYQTGYVSAFSNNQFTITWTKTGSPTGTATIMAKIDY